MFNLLSDPTKHGVRNYEVSSSALLDPTDTNPLYIGEWMDIDGSNQAGRATGDLPSYAVWTPRGDASAQYTQKVALITVAGYKAETQIYDSTGLAAVGVGAPLRVEDVTIDGQTKSGLMVWTAGTDYIVGRALILPTADYAWITFQAADPSRFA